MNHKLIFLVLLLFLVPILGFSISFPNQQNQSKLRFLSDFGNLSEEYNLSGDGSDDLKSPYETPYSFLMYNSNKVYVPFYTTDGSSIEFNVVPMPYYTDASLSHNGISLKFSRRDLNQDYCKVNLNSTSLNSNLKSNYLALDMHPKYIPDSFLQDYYYMKTLVKAELFKFNSIPTEIIIYPQNSNKTVYSYGGNSYTNYLLAKPSPVSFDFDYSSTISELQTSCNANGSSCGGYYWKITAEPIDGKCDINSNNNLTDEVESDIKYSNGANIFSSILSAIFTIEPQFCEATYSDIEISGNNIILNGLKTKESQTSFDSLVYLRLIDESKTDYNEYFVFPDGGTPIAVDSYITFYNSNYLYFKSQFVDLVDDTNRKDIYDDYILFDGTIYDNYFDGGHHQVEAYSDLNSNINLNNTPKNLIFNLSKLNTLNIGRNFSIEVNVLPKNTITDTCNFTFRTTRQDDNHKFIVDSDSIEYNEFSLDQGILEKNDNHHKNKVSFDFNLNQFRFKNSRGELQSLNLDNIENMNKTIDIYLNDNLIRKDKINPRDIALNSHIIQKTKQEPNSVEDFINKSYDLMTKFVIEKHIDTISSPGNTRIKIKLNNSGTSQIQDLVIYQIIPKELLSDFENLNILNNGNGEFIVLDKDPVIGWYFNTSTGDEEIEYEIPGNSEGGTIIITQEPILFNEGELIVNYREDNCAVGEAHLFDLDDLESSQIKTAGTSTYKVCVAHLTEDLYTSGINELKLFNHSGNVSINEMMNYTNQIRIATNNPNIYWNLEVSKNNPDGTFSCLGSVDNLNNALFGDCGYNVDNRLWIHLGEDIRAPKTELSYPLLSHTIKVNLDANDFYGSGVKNLTYRVDKSNWKTIDSDHVDFFLTCPSDWGCIKEVEFFSADLAGNVEDINSYLLTIVDKGSACQADCSARPSPNRYLKDCRNLNGCSFYPFDNLGNFDDGEYVADKCHMVGLGQTTYFNETHDIVCPAGPLKKSRFTTNNVYFLDSFCENIIKTPYPVILGGQQIILNIISCFNS